MKKPETAADIEKAKTLKDQYETLLKSAKRHQNKLKPNQRHYQ